MRKSRLCSLLCTVAAAALGAGCGLSVKSDYNKALVSSVHCGTYAWAGAFRGSSALRNTIANPVNEERLRAAIASHVSPATIQPVGSSADCLVGYGIGGNYVVDGGYPYGYGWGYGWGYGGYYGWGGPYVYREGIIAVDLYDAKSGQPIWHASADQSLFDVSGDKAATRIDEAVAAIFAKRPG